VYNPLHILKIVALSAVVVWLTACRRQAVPPRVEFTFQKVAFQVGESTLRVHATQVGTSMLTMVNLHEDERTSVEAGRIIQEKHGGRLIRLVHSGIRRPAFLLNGGRFNFDPNRVFSEAGVGKTVRGTAAIPDEAYAAVRGFSGQFVEHFGLARAQAIIALHNNDDAHYSIHSYQPGAELEADTDEIFINPDADPDDFYFVTDRRFFRQLKEQKFNVVLQDNRIRRDDGSLSVFAGRRGIPYMNVEAQNEHLEEQTRMLEVAYKITAETLGKL
jgi:hypothetical protein